MDLNDAVASDQAMAPDQAVAPDQAMAPNGAAAFDGAVAFDGAMSDQAIASSIQAVASNRSMASQAPDKQQHDAIQPVFSHHTVRSFRAFFSFFGVWFRVMWPDLLIMVVLGGAAIRINAAPLLGTRTFPVTFDRSGDIVFPSLAYPNRGWIVSPLLTGILCSVIPMSVILLSQFRVRSFWDANNGIMGLGLALLMGIVSKLLIKHLVGGFRPSFLQVCMPDTSLAAARNASGLNGVGFQQAFYTADICTQPDKGALKVAMTSFPSGHTTVASAGFGFLYLYLNGKLKVISASRPRLWTAVLLVLPLLAAFLMGAILTVDRAHHWYDILAGAVIGTVTALIAYRSCYAATWDWRYNHIPLARGETFLYKPGNAAQSRHGVLANRDWGKPRPREEEQLGIEMEEMV